MNIKIHRSHLISVVTAISFTCIVSCQQHSTVNSDFISFPNYPFGKINPAAPTETAQLGQLIGQWDCISRDKIRTGEDSFNWYTNRATWEWRYILGGHALLNNWRQEDTSPNPISKSYFAAGIFIINKDTKSWEAVVMNSRPHKISPKFSLTYKDEQLLMQDSTGNWLVTFYDINPESFQWKYELLQENGEWNMISHIKARRSRNDKQKSKMHPLLHLAFPSL